MRAGGRRFDLAERPPGEPHPDPGMHDRPGRGRRPDTADQVRGECRRRSDAQPVLLAKQCATIDVLSEGRMLPGFGIGSPRGPEWDAMHLDPATRSRRTDEALEIISRLWKGESVTCAGKHFRLTNASIAPLPVQAEFSMWIGGSSEAAIRRTARSGTGWHRARIRDARDRRPGDRCDQATPPPREGRSIDEDHYGAAFDLPLRRRGRTPRGESDGALHGPHRARRSSVHLAFGDADAIVERIARYVANDACSSSCARRRMGTRICTRRPGGSWRRCCRG